MTCAEKLRIALLKLLNINELRVFAFLIYNIDLSIIHNLNWEYKVDQNVDPMHLRELETQIEKLTTRLSFNTSNHRFHIQFYETCLQKYTVGQVLGLLVHNILHILNGHNLRAKNHNQDLFELAADHVINSLLIADTIKGNLKSIELVDPYIIDDLIGRDVTTEEAYSFLYKNHQNDEQFKIAINKNGSPTKGQNSKDGDQLGPEDQQDDTSNDQDEQNKNDQDDTSNDQDDQNKNDQDESNQSTQNSNDQNELNDIDDDGNNDQELTGTYTKIKKKLVYNINNISHASETSQEQMTAMANKISEMKSGASLFLEQDSVSRGSKSGKTIEYLKKITKLEVPWETILEKAILVNTVCSPDVRSWMNPMKRLRAHNIILPGNGIDRKLETCVIVIDSSGSITSQNLMKFSGICSSALTQFDRVWILKHDVKVYSNEIIKGSELENSHFLCEFKGRGGTSHDPVYKIIENEFIHNKQGVKIGLIIFLTDFESDIEKIWNKYKWTKEIPVIHLLTHPAKVPKHIDDSPILIKDITEN